MTRPRFLPAAALLTTAALALAGCGGTGTDSPHADDSGATGGRATSTISPGSGATDSYHDQIMAWGRRFAACARAHGIPTFPDPVYPVNAQATGSTSGFALFAAVGKRTLAEAVNGACNDIAQQMPPAADADSKPNATTLAHMRQYAQCMRQQGLSAFPDPKADGTFPIGNTRYAGLSNLDPGHPAPAVADADRACHRYSIDWEIRAS
jgi:hypothetical protein